MHFFSPSDSPASGKPGKKVKPNRRWDNAATGAEAAALDFSSGSASTATSNGNTAASNQGDSAGTQGLKLSASEAANLTRLRGTMQEGFDELEVSSDEEAEDESDGEQDSKEIKQNGGNVSS